MFLFISDLEFLINVLEGRVKAMQRGYFLMFKSKKQMKNRIRQLKKKIIKLEKRIIDLDNITFWVFIWISSNLFNVVVELRLFCFIMITLFVFTVFRNLRLLFLNSFLNSFLNRLWKKNVSTRFVFYFTGSWKYWDFHGSVYLKFELDLSLWIT